jgi:homoserine acetyltransferase
MGPGVTRPIASSAAAMMASTPKPAATYRASSRLGESFSAPAAARHEKGRVIFYADVITESIRNDPDYNGGDYVKQPSHWIYTIPAQRIMTGSRVRTYEAAPTREKAIELFDKIVDELNKVLANLEGSTLVKRLKAASRKPRCR